MNAFVQALLEGITADALWSIIAGFAGLVIMMVLFAFAYRVVKRIIRSIPKGKAGV